MSKATVSTYTLPTSTLPTTTVADTAVEGLYTPIFIITAFFGAVFIIGPLVVRKGENRGIIRTCIMLTAFCMWLFWVTVYIAQMNPLMGLVMHNTTLAWMSYKWFDSILCVTLPLFFMDDSVKKGSG